MRISDWSSDVCSSDLPSLVACDQPGRGAEDRPGGAVVLFEPDHPGAREVLLEAQDVADLGAAPGIDRLVVVADAGAVAVLLGEQAQPQILGDVGVMVLVDQDVVEPVMVFGETLDRQVVQQGKSCLLLVIT